MSINIIKQPYRSNPTKNPVIFGLQSDNQYSSTGVYSVNTIRILRPPVAGDTLLIAFGSESITFTFALSPDASGTQLPTNYSGMPTADYFDLLAEYIAMNYTINSAYTITTTAGNIYLTAKEYGDDYDITFTPSDPYCISTSIKVNGVDSTQRTFFRIVVQIYCDDENIGEERLSVDSDGIAYIDIAEYLLPQLTPSFMWPQLPATLYENKSDMSAFFYIRYGESYGTPPDVYAMMPSSSYYVAIPGGISDTLLQIYNSEGTNFDDRMRTTKQWLTNQYTTKKVRNNQPEQLFFLITDSATSTVYVNYTIYYTDSTSTSIVKSTITGVTRGDILEIITGYNINSLVDEEPTKTILKWDVWLTNGSGTIISQTFTYILETKPQLYDRYFIFKNSLGGYDTLRTVGIGRKDVQVSRQKLVKLLDLSGSDLTDRAKRDFIDQATDIYTVNTGHAYNKETRDYLTEIMISDDVYQVVNNTLIPIVIDTDKAFIYEDDNFLYELEFSYQIAYTGSSYSIDQELLESLHGDYNNDYNSDYNIQ